MGYNTKTFDQDAHYALKSIEELIELRNKFAEHITKYPHSQQFVDAHAVICIKISERIGRKK